MSLLNESFVTDEAEDMSFEVLPVGEYTAQIKKAEIKTTKDGEGEYISCQWEIMEAKNIQHEGRTVFQNLNLVNKNEMAVKIARSQLRQITLAMGIDKLDDTDELVGQPLRIILKIRPAKGGYEASNDIAKVMPLEQNKAGETQPWAE